MPHRQIRIMYLTLYLLLLFSASQLTKAQQGDASDASRWVAPSYKARKKNPISLAAVSVDRGKQLFMQQCVVCHGTSGKGDGVAAAALKPIPADLSASVVQAQSDGALFWKLSTGRAPMPAFETIIAEEDRWNIVNFVRSLTSE